MSTARARELPSIGSRTEPFVESVIREMTRLGAQTGAINLSQGVPDFDSPAEVIEAAVEAIRGVNNQYTFSFGSPEFRAAIARKSATYNHIPCDPETEVTVTCGVSEAIVSALIGLSNPGDEMIVLEPWFEIYIPDCIIAGITPRFVPMREPDYTFDPDELRAAFNKRTRFIMVNTPHNPTGRMYTQEELEVIAGLCQEFNVIAITDEIYEHIYFNDRQHISLGSLEGMEDRTVTISGLGKSYSVTGWRVGWAVADQRLTTPIRRVHDYLTVCAPAPFQAAGTVALGLPESYYREMRAEFAARRDVLTRGIREAGMTCLEPEGAYYVMADFAEVEWDSDRYMRPGWTLDRAFAEYMAREIGVAVVPGTSFYEGRRLGHTRLRFNFAKRVDTLQEAADRMKRLKG
ncbi:MAG: aminotransferase class I/II-fold pyridoxal phosphate-dependent enzyme [Anaerolineae bacterium]|nr:aminotransferase class I/II-fold pyridoxal phosphate-dependent enzyme [Anaerolineae bacterium]